MSDNMLIYAACMNTPQNARKEIQAGRLKGFTDINPMFRIKTLTELFGPCGIGWYVTPNVREIVAGANGEVKAFVQLSLFVKYNGEWSAPIIGEGGASFVSKERNGDYTDDEAYKKAFTDALGSACKMLGMSADIYYSADRTKYTATATETPAKTEKTKVQEQTKPTEAAKERDELQELIEFYATIKCVPVGKVMTAITKNIGQPLTVDTYPRYVDFIREKIKEEGKKE